MIANCNINISQTHRKEKGAQGGNKKEKSPQNITKVIFQANWAYNTPNDTGTTRPKLGFS